MNSTASRTPVWLADIGNRLSRGSIAGLSAGLLFLVANMAWATRGGGSAAGPLLAFSTIFKLTDTPVATPQNVVVGLVTHLTLSMLFGVGFALLLPALRDGRALALGALGFGLGLYLLNIQLLGRTAFPAFRQADQLFELLAHAAFGLLLAPFFIGMLRPRPAPSPGSNAVALTTAP
jgi:mannose/fructose/N-acetylgalactosamine-specific phosphotransferase system component IIC